MTEQSKGDIWAPLEINAPELLDDMAFKNSVTLDDREVHRYIHKDTGLGLNLDITGQAWWIAEGISERGDVYSLAGHENLTEAKAWVQDSKNMDSKNMDLTEEDREYHHRIQQAAQLTNTQLRGKTR